MNYCSSCGKQLPDGAQFCPSCGAPAHLGTTATASVAPRSGFDALGKNPSAREYWVKRLVAFIIDAVIIGAVVGLASASLVFYTFLTGPITVDRFFSSFWAAGVPAALSGLVLVLYFTIAESSFGTTVGKSIIGLKVRTNDGRLPPLGTSFIRNVSKIYWVLLLLDVVIGLAIEADYKKKLSDRYLKTIVLMK